jgi:hypothetical protein
MPDRSNLHELSCVIVVVVAPVRRVQRAGSASEHFPPSVPLTTLQAGLIGIPMDS